MRELHNVVVVTLACWAQEAKSRKKQKWGLNIVHATACGDATRLRVLFTRVGSSQPNGELLKLLLSSVVQHHGTVGRRSPVSTEGGNDDRPRLGRTLPAPSSPPQKRNTESSAERRPTISPWANMTLLFCFGMRHLFIFPILTPPAGAFLFGKSF